MLRPHIEPSELNAPVSKKKDATFVTQNENEMINENEKDKLRAFIANYKIRKYLISRTDDGGSSRFCGI